MRNNLYPAVKWPATKAELKVGGYFFLRERFCVDEECKRRIFFFQTPEQRVLPCDFDPETKKYNSHYLTCPAAKRMQERREAMIGGDRKPNKKQQAAKEKRDREAEDKLKNPTLF